MSTTNDEDDVDDALRMTDRMAVRKGKKGGRKEGEGELRRGGTKRRVGGRKADWIGEEDGNTTDGENDHLRKDAGKQGFVQGFAKLLAGDWT